MHGVTTCTGRASSSTTDRHASTRMRARLVPESSGEDARLSTAIGEFDPRRDRERGGMFHGGELHLQCGCGRFDSGPLHARLRSGVVQRQDAGL